MGAAHFVLHEEEEAFADWINKRLQTDKDVIHFLPLAVSLFIFILKRSVYSFSSTSSQFIHFLPF